MPGWQKTPADRQRDNRVYGAAWRTARLACLRAANWHCQVRTAGVCIGAATQVDHIDGAASDPQHQRLRATCAPCHAKITTVQGNAAQRGRSDPAIQQRTSW